MTPPGLELLQLITPLLRCASLAKHACY